MTTPTPGLCVAHRDDSLTLLTGDAMEQTRHLPDGSIDCVVTSPPYFGLRDYEGVRGQVGLENSPAEFVARLVGVFREVRRVLAEDGTLWLNLGDSYSGGSRKTYDTVSGKTGSRGLAQTRPVSGLPGKNLLGIPWRTALALQSDGWILRNDVIWSKPNAMPESVTDRLSSRHEHLFLFSKSGRYQFNLDGIRSPRDNGERGPNPGDVWSINTRPFAGAHFATFPIELPRRCILAGCKPNGVVLDPFSGAGTTALAALQLNRRAIGIDINPKYHAIALRRLRLEEAA